MSDAVHLDTRERVFVGILLTSIAYALFSVQDAAIKLLVAGFAVWQILFFRSVTILTACFFIGGPELFADAARSRILKPMLLRSFFILAAWLSYYTAARDLQLAELTTIYFAAPLIVPASRPSSSVRMCRPSAGLRWWSASSASSSPAIRPVSACLCRSCWR